MTGRVTIVDSGICNLGSIVRAFQRVGANVCVTSERGGVLQAERLVLPGVGSFPAGMAALNAQGLSAAIVEFVKTQRPLLGICLGMQLLFEVGEEFGITQGLGLVPGRVRAFSKGALRVPHMGWNEVNGTRPDPLLAGIDGRYLYFVHSFICDPVERGDVLATTVYGESFCSVVRHGNVWGVQPHPEKSQRAGQRLLRNFMELTA